MRCCDDELVNEGCDDFSEKFGMEWRDFVYEELGNEGFCAVYEVLGK